MQCRLIITTGFSVVLLVLGLAGCIEIPRQHIIVGSHPGEPVITDSEASCRQEPALPGHAGLDPAGFTVLNWNLFKGRRAGWLGDLRWLGAETDILLLQEGQLGGELDSFLDDNAFDWGLAAAFAYRENETGVLTAAKVEADSFCSFRTPEPLIRLPKTAIVTRYPIAGRQESLMVANVHGINFSLGLEAFREQLTKVADLVSLHDGPLILAGDFNAWSASRREVVADIVGALGLRPLAFDIDHRTTVFGHPLDQVYFRDLVAQQTLALPVNTSDHNPITVTFALLPGSAPPFAPRHAPGLVRSD